MKKLTHILLTSLLLFGSVACAAKTSTSSPDSVTDSDRNLTESGAEMNQDDASSESRKRQLDSDIRSREQRNDITGGDTIRADGDLQSEVRSKLEANLPASELTVEAEDGAVAIAGTVVAQDQLSKIEPLAREIKGVKSVTVNAKVVPAAEP